MQELPDDQLDRLFRKSLEESEPVYDPAAWPGMEEKLTTYDRQQFWQRWLRRAVPVVVALVLPVSVWLLIRDSSSADPTGRTRPTQSTTGLSSRRSVVRSSEKPAVPSAYGSLAENTAIAESEPGREESADHRTTSTVTAAQNNRLQSSAPALTANSLKHTKPKQPEGIPSATAVFSTQSESTVGTPLANRTTTRTTRTKRLHTTKQSVADLVTTGPASPIRASRGPVGRESGENAVVSVVNQQTTVVESPDDRLKLVIEPLRGLSFATVGQSSAISRPLPVPISDAQPAQSPVASQDRTTGLSVRAMVSPDLSSVGLTNFSRPGTNVGLLLEYQLRRWHVQAGVLRSVKVYQAAESAYEYSAVRQWPVVPSSIDGRCNMLDIPINLRYDVALIPRRRALPPSRWFVSAGATTYYMLREDYTYKYDNPADPNIKYRDWTTETGRYGFSQLNVSGGYERAVTQRLFWQVEPFLKVPLKGVGYYKINLLSTGVFFSLRYRL